MEKKDYLYFLTPPGVLLAGNMMNAALDPVLQAAVDEYLDKQIEKEAFESGTESFELHAKRLRLEESEKILHFVKSYRSGQQLIKEQLEKSELAFPALADAEKLKIFSDVEAFTQAINEGKQVYELLGFTSETFATLYTAAYQYVEQKDFQKALDAFLYLIALAKDIPALWLNLAICHTQLGEYEKGVEAALFAIELDPNNPEPYLQALHLYTLLGDTQKALELCDKETENNELFERLQEAKQYLQGVL